VAAPAQQRSQVISRSEHPRARSPGCTFFVQSWRPLLVVALKTKGRQRRWDCFTVKIKQIKRSAVRYGKNFYFLFTLLPKQSKATGRVDPGREYGRWILHRRPDVVPPLLQTPRYRQRLRRHPISLPKPRLGLCVRVLYEDFTNTRQLECKSSANHGELVTLVYSRIGHESHLWSQIKDRFPSSRNATQWN